MRLETGERKLLTRLEVLALVVVVAASRVLAMRSCWTYDDAFISYRYAVNLANGAGMVFNPGAAWEPVLGTTTPGFTVLIAGCVALGFDAVRAALSIGVACDVSSALWIVLLLGRERGAATLALGGFAAMPELARVSVGGMEAPLFAAAALAATWLRAQSRLVASGILAAVACSIRPEAVLLVATLAWLHRRSKAELVALLTPVAVLGTLYTVALSAYYGSPVPHSIVSKAQVHAGSPLLETWGDILRQALLPRWVYAPLLVPAALGVGALLGRRAPSRPFVLFALAMVGAYLAARPHTWGWYYYIPLIGWVMAVAVGIARGAALVAPRWPVGARWVRAALVPGGSALVLAACAMAARALPDTVTPLVYDPMREWAREAGLGQEGPLVTILASDIGAVGYFTGERIYDSEGLVWPEALREEYESPMDLVLATLPDYVLLVASRPRVADMRAHEALTRAYYPIRRFSSLGETRLEPELASLPEHWVQDYLLYRRRL